MTYLSIYIWVDKLGNSIRHWQNRHQIKLTRCSPFVKLAPVHVDVGHDDVHDELEGVGLTGGEEGHGRFQWMMGTFQLRRFRLMF